MFIKCVPSRRMSFVAAAMSLVGSVVWLAPAIVLKSPGIWVAAGVPQLMVAIVFYLRGSRIPPRDLRDNDGSRV